MKKSDILGCRFGMLTVIEDSGLRKGNSILWRCRCDCGGAISSSAVRFKTAAAFRHLHDLKRLI